MNASSAALETFKPRKAAINNHPSIFTDIYQEDVNIAIWQRDLTTTINSSVDDFLASYNQNRTSLIASPDSVYEKLTKSVSEPFDATALCEDISELVEMFCVLFDVDEVGLRLTELDRAMCPRFHVDRVPCRLVCTYRGVASEWLPHDVVDRRKLGRGNNGLDDRQSGLYQEEQQINKMTVGDVALLKGELWEGNEHAGLVHRSPHVHEGEKRLLLTLDFLS